MMKKTWGCIVLLFLSFHFSLLTAQAQRPEVIKFHTPKGTLSLQPLTENAVRVRFTAGDFAPLDELLYTEQVVQPKWKINKGKTRVEVVLKGMRIAYDIASQHLTFCDGKGRVLLEEMTDGRSVTPTDVRGTAALDVTQRFCSPDDECIFGTGQFQDGYLNIRGLSRRLTQVNTQISIPMLLSSRGYGLLWNNYGMTELNPPTDRLSLTPANEAGETISVTATSDHGTISERRTSDTFVGEFDVEATGDYTLLLDCGQSMSRRQWLSVDGKVVVDQNNTWLPPTTSVILPLTAGRHNVVVKGVRGDRPSLGWRRVEGETVLHSPVAQALDYTVFAGTPDEVIATYRTLTGPAPLMPDYMLGYVHCRERYHTQQELLDNARKFREKGIPADVIVQDWQYWGKHGWNAMQFDEDNYPDPKQMVDDLHRMDFRLMLSVWSRIDPQSTLGSEFTKRGYFIPNTNWIDFFNKNAASFYWQNFRDRLVRPYHIDAWWLDATEPENDDLMGRNVAAGKLPGELVRNVYPMKVVSTVYEGLRGEQSKDATTPIILTRSAFAGMQRYNAITWSGDVGNDFETLRRQIVGGLGYSACGLPWWTFDAGGFFRPNDQYTDAAYQERMLRWIQCSVFLPVMRVHGYISNTEPWNYSPETEQVFCQCIEQRYKLLPYLKECARKVSKEHYTLMRPLVFDFGDDPEALRQQTEYMFGPRYLVCPILEAGVKTWRVYLPKNKKGWDTFDGSQHYDGGQYVDVPVTLSSIPVFVRR